MKDWITELCPEIAEWQAELIAEQAEKEVAAEREACAKVCESIDAEYEGEDVPATWCAGAIRTIRATGETK